MTTEKSKKGRPTKFTSEISKDIINSLTAGATLSDAARYVGVTVTDIQHWIARKKDFGVKCKRAIAQKRILALKMEYEGIREGNQRVVNDFLNREERKRQNRENIKLKREENGVTSLSPIDLNDWAAEQNAAFMGEQECTDSSDT